MAARRLDDDVLPVFGTSPQKNLFDRLIGILVDFIELRLKEGMPLAQAVTDAGVWMKWACSQHASSGHSATSTKAWPKRRKRLRVVSRR